MKLIKKYKPYLIFWISIPIVMLLCILSENEVADISVHDTYVVISDFHLAYLISILFGIIGFGYWMMMKLNRRLSKWLTLIHLCLTLGGVIAIWVTNEIVTHRTLNSNGLSTLNVVITALVLATILGQLFFLINLVIGLIRKQ
jgi:heme/copper-type cytochrome/quinol oxidase subunit 1